MSVARARAGRRSPVAIVRLVRWAGLCSLSGILVVLALTVRGREVWVLSWHVGRFGVNVEGGVAGIAWTRERYAHQGATYKWTAWVSNFWERGYYSKVIWYSNDDVVRGVFVPLWIPAAVLVPLTVVAWLKRVACAPAGCCAQCGYNLTGNVSGICPECGTLIPRSAESKPKERT